MRKYKLVIEVVLSEEEIALATPDSIIEDALRYSGIQTSSVEIVNKHPRTQNDY